MVERLAVKVLQLLTERLVEKSWDNGGVLLLQENTVGTLRQAQGKLLSGQRRRRRD